MDVLLPLHLPGIYTYRVPFEYNDAVKVGQRVVVQFGSKKLYSAIVKRVHENVPSYNTKYILSILDINPIVTEKQLAFWDWIADYYMCYPGDVAAIAIPTGLKLASESYITIHPDFSGELSSVGPDELQILTLLSEKGSLTVTEVSEIVEFNRVMPLIKNMIEKKIILSEEDIKERFKPKTAVYLSLNPYYREEQNQKDLFDQLEARTSSHKQLSVLMKFMMLSSFGKEAVKKQELARCEGLSKSAIQTLIKNEVLWEEERIESRLVDVDNEMDSSEIILNSEQQTALDILQLPSSQPVSLLHGVTSSGKTEIYIKMISNALENGKQVLFLLPEIALTTQLINRLRKYFGKKVGIYHSRFSHNERIEIWNKTLDDSPEGYQVLVGARSAMFLPFHNLGLVIVDEEHDSSYKQQDTPPKYQGRDAAIYLAHLWGAKTVLGSATPSIESYYNARSGKYSLAELKSRFGGIKMPEVLCADMKDAYKKGEIKQGFSTLLLDQVKEAVNNKEQVILYQNRRGYAPRIECEVCHWIPECQNCDVSLVYHKESNQLKCHYCGFVMPVPDECPNCHSRNLKMKGSGTERIEDDLSILFPDANIARLDLDSVSKKNRYAEIISDFEERRIDILVGTQMVTKGLDFDNVSVVGIVNADSIIAYPDFRSYERSFQQMAQVSGRAGRRNKQGKVIIQTFNPWHQAIRDVMGNDYESMYSGQMVDRKVYKYPPFYKLIDITLRHRDQYLLNDAAALMAQKLRMDFSEAVMGPEFPSIPRIRNQFIKKILLRFPRTDAIKEYKKRISQYAEEVKNTKTLSGITIIFDVDPQ